MSLLQRACGQSGTLQRQLVACSASAVHGASPPRRQRAASGPPTAAPRPLHALRARPSPRRARACGPARALRPGIDNAELLMGDSIALVAFSLWKQISSIALAPDFPGWLAPLRFNPDRWFEFASLTATLVAAWALAAALTGGLSYRASRSVPDALRAASWAWLVSMPIAAAQLTLVVAAESRALVGTEGFAAALPLAAQGPGEPVATAAGVLGVMSVWRCLYAVWLDPWSSAAARAASDAAALREALAAAAALAALGGAALQVAHAAAGGRRRVTGPRPGPLPRGLRRRRSRRFKQVVLMAAVPVCVEMHPKRDAAALDFDASWF
ncbi:MAG: hypothetical protein J3K34DRAFT_389251 [Monoraphidium minutum]|nr:MAG: hypothetical protein J3K34DRAFT_389251 [Monoraphidium minutum]